MRLVADRGGHWVFCDTDSLFIVATKHGGLVACPSGDQVDDGTPAVTALVGGRSTRSSTCYGH